MPRWVPKLLTCVLSPQQCAFRRDQPLGRSAELQNRRRPICDPITGLRVRPRAQETKIENDVKLLLLQSPRTGFRGHGDAGQVATVAR